MEGFPAQPACVSDLGMEAELSHMDFIKLVADLYPDYRASDTSLESVRGTHLTTVTAPSAMGKDFTIQGAKGVTDELFGIELPAVVSDTDRNPRENEVDGIHYHFRQHERYKIVDELQNSQYVQIGMGAGDSFYGSRPSAYPESGPALMDVVSEQIDVMRHMPFASFGAAYIVTTYESWMAQLAHSRKFTVAQLENRLLEAQNSLTKGLEDSEVVHILNERGGDAPLTLARFVLEREIDKERSLAARRVAAAVLNRLSDELS